MGLLWLMMLTVSIANGWHTAYRVLFVIMWLATLWVYWERAGDDEDDHRGAVA